MQISKFKLSYLALCLVVLFPLYQVHWNSYAIIILALASFYESLKDTYSRNSFLSRVSANKAVFFKTTLLFFPFALSLVYSDNISVGSKGLQHILPMIIFPLILFFFMDGLTKKDMFNLFKVFFIGCFLHAIYLQYNFFQLELFNSFDEISFYNMPFREAVLLLKYEALHPTYVSLWYCFAICIGFHHFKTSNSIVYRAIIVLAIALFLFTIVLLSSRIAILSLGFLAIFQLVLMKKNSLKLILGIVLLGVITFGITKVKFISSRIVDEFSQTKLAPPVGKRHNSINIRVGIYKCALELIGENPILGVGIGDVQQELNSCYLQYNTDVYQMDEYNSHGYFLHAYLVGGFIAFMALLYMFYFFSKIALDSMSFLYGCFLIIVLSGMLFENILSRNHGILFFAIFNSIFISYHYLNNTNANGSYSSLQ